MRLNDYIREVGAEKFSRDFRVKRRTVDSWLRNERKPRTKLAQKIVAKTPVTMEGIYAA